jgi:hypothetical protein
MLELLALWEPRAFFLLLILAREGLFSIIADPLMLFFL